MYVAPPTDGSELCNLDGIVDDELHLRTLLNVCHGRFPPSSPRRHTVWRHSEEDEDQLALSCWQLLRRLPTSQFVLQLLADPGMVDWSRFLAAPGEPLTAYVMQATMYYLRPSFDVQYWPSSLPPSSWFFKFVR